MSRVPEVRRALIRILVRLRLVKRSALGVIGILLSLIAQALPGDIAVGLKENLRLTRQMDYRRERIMLSLHSRTEYYTRLHSCSKEPDTVEWIETCFNEGDTFWDIGANVGAYSLVACKFYHGKVSVYAFEPAFPNFATLCENILLNKCEQCVVPMQIALSDTTAIGAFHYHNVTPGGSLHAFGLPIDYLGNPFKPLAKQSVLAFRIDDVVSILRVPCPNHLKIDVDGTELQILMGAPDTLADPRLRSILLELVEESRTAHETHENIFRLLADAGFELHSRHLSNSVFKRAPRADALDNGGGHNQSR